MFFNLIIITRESHKKKFKFLVLVDKNNLLIRRYFTNYANFLFLPDTPPSKNLIIDTIVYIMSINIRGIKYIEE